MARLEPTDVTFFETAAELRAWLARHHDSADELWVGLRRKSSGQTSVTWPEVVDEALCQGWIDGIRKRIDDVSYANRITPRRRGSTWSAINVARVKALQAEGRMQPAGLAAFQARLASKTAVYSYEVRPDGLPAESEAHILAVPAARAFWEGQSRTYRQTAAHWVTSAKQETTRERRLNTLIESCAAGELIPPMRYGRDRIG